MVPPDLPPGEIHLWRIRLEGRSDRWALWSHLNEAERRQAGSFYRAEHGERFASARGVLRALIAAYQRQTPSQVAFITGPWGKPEVAPQGELRLSFNLSHSADWGLAAFARQGRLGIDLERVRHLPDALSIARRQFAPAECAWLTSADPQQQAEVFFRIWTRKEAVLKGVGAGLSLDLCGFNVTGVPGGGELHALSLGAGHPPINWRWLEFEPAEGFTACLVADEEICRVRTWEFGEPATPLR